MKKIEWRKINKELYFPRELPEVIEIPVYKYFTIKGEGNPNSDLFKESIGALYSLSYGARMSYKWNLKPEDYYEYTVYPLESTWDLIDVDLFKRNGFDKNNLKFELMIRQPEFVNDDFFKRLVEKAIKKSDNKLIEKVEFKSIKEGLCVQIMHVGSYDTETRSFNKMNDFIDAGGYYKTTMHHKEIYLTHPLKTEESKLKTVLRYYIK